MCCLGCISLGCLGSFRFIQVVGCLVHCVCYVV
nr:MAG TPA: hypothetical protein [Caudoviricetes sp.]